MRELACKAKKYQPDFTRLENAILRRGDPGNVACWELFIDAELIQSVLGKPLMAPLGNMTAIANNYVDRLIEFQLMMGYDFLPIFIDPMFSRSNVLLGSDTASLPKERRSWVDEHHGMINSWQDFENYPWHTPEDISYVLLESAVRRVPDGMKVCVWTSGILENVQWLMGYEPMSYATVEQPDLIDALFDRVGAMITSIFDNAASVPGVGLLAMGDDMGFRTGTLFSPKFLRQHVFPLQKKCVLSAHCNGHPFILHSCGQLKEIMNDLIDDVGIDAKHSYEDAILPVEEAVRLYGARIAIVGGIDVDLLSRGTEEIVRKRTRSVLEQCASTGGYVMGTGNSGANYIPIQNFIALLDETRLWNEQA